MFLAAAAILNGYERPDAEAILRSFCADFARNDDLPAQPFEFGIKLLGDSPEAWTIIIREKAVHLQRGLPKKPSFVVTSDIETLEKVYRGEMNALTAICRADDSEKTPMDIELEEGYRPSEEEIRNVIPRIYFHFFTRGKPEIVSFGEAFSRLVHGANNVLIYGEKGLRLSWYQVKKGLFINKESTHMNPFPSFFIFTKGKGKGRIGDKLLDIREGMSILVPPGTVHQFWTEGEDILEMILVMFGEKA
jgi:mannose-6-phosphate isomerase-like protein (cupin superfamily)